MTTIDLYAQQLGYGTFWCGLLHMALKNQKVRSILHITDDENVICCLGFGKPNIKFNHPSIRKDLEIQFD